MNPAPGETERIAIVDSIGPQALHSKYRELLSFCEFSGTEPPNLRGEPIHPHGGMVAWCALSQESTRKKLVRFIRQFDRNGSADGSNDAWVRDALREFRPHRSLNSWGAYGGGGLDEYYNQRWIDLWMEANGDADQFFAAGNEGRLAENYPQRGLVGKPTGHIVAACDARGVPAAFSSTGAKGERYPDCTYLGVSCLVVDPITGKVTAVDGTSFAAPNCGGDASARGLSGEKFKAYQRAFVLTDIEGDGVPNGVHPDLAPIIRAGGYHAQIGVGICEESRQQNMRTDGLPLGVTASRRVHQILGDIIEVRAAYHDFQRQ